MLHLPMEPVPETLTFLPDRRSRRQAWLAPLAGLLVFGAFFAFGIPDDCPKRALWLPGIGLFVMFGGLSAVMFLRRWLYRLDIRCLPDGAFSITEKLPWQRTGLVSPDSTVKKVKIAGSGPFLRSSGGFAFGRMLSDAQREEIAALINQGKDPHVQIGNMRIH